MSEKVGTVSDWEESPFWVARHAWADAVRVYGATSDEAEAARLHFVEVHESLRSTY